MGDFLTQTTSFPVLSDMSTQQERNQHNRSEEAVRLTVDYWLSTPIQWQFP